MGLARLLAARGLLQRFGRTGFSILGVAVGIATVVCVFALDHNTIEGRKVKTERSSEGDWMADLEVRPRPGLADPRADLDALEGVEDVTAFFQNDVLARAAEGDAGDGDGARQRVRLVAVEAAGAPYLGAYHLLEGRDLDPAASRPEALVGRGLAQALGLSVGSHVLLARPPRAAGSICREGQERELAAAPDPREEAFEVVGVLTGEGVGRKSQGQVVLVDYGPGAELFSESRLEPRFWLRRDPEVNLERIKASLGRKYSYELSKSVIVGEAADERAFRNGVRMAGFMALMLGLYVIFHTLSMSLVERVREVGVLHALGATRAQIARAFFTEAVVISVGAGFLGLGAGLFLARKMLLHGITTVGVGQHITFFEVPWDLIGPLVGIGVAIALLGSVYPLMKARGTDVVSALRGEDPAHGAGLARGFRLFSALLILVVLPTLYFALVPIIGEVQRSLIGLLVAGIAVLSLLLGLPLAVPAVLSVVCNLITRPFERRWPLAGQLTARAIRQSPTRISAAVAAVALVTAAFVGLKGMTNSLLAEVEVWADGAVLDKVWVRNLPDVRLDDVRGALAPLDEVVAVESGDVRTYVPFLLIGVSEEALAAYGPCQRRPNLLQAMRAGQGMIISQRLARHLDYEPGDVHQVNTSGHGVQSFPIIAVSDEYGYFPWPDERMFGVVSDRWMRRYFCLDTETLESAALVLRPGADTEAPRALLEGAFGPIKGGNYQSGAEVLAWQLEDIGRDFRLFDIILGMTALLAGMGVLNGLLLAALERSKELGVLKALGVTRRQVAGTVLLESLVIGVVGGVLGVIIGSGLTPLIVRALQEISDLPLPFRSAGPFLALALVGAPLVTLLAGLYPIWRMNRFDAVRAVRTG